MLEMTNVEFGALFYYLVEKIILTVKLHCCSENLRDNVEPETCFKKFFSLLMDHFGLLNNIL